MKMNFGIIFLLVAAVACTAPPDASKQLPSDSGLVQTAVTASPSTNQLVVPGKRIGSTQINERSDSVFHRLGNPDSSDAAMGKSRAAWISKDDPSHTTRISFSTNMGMEEAYPQAKTIRVTSSYFKTGAGNSVGRSLSDFTIEFPNLKRLGDAGEAALWTDPSLGIWVEVLTDRRVVAIGVFDPKINLMNSYPIIGAGMDSTDRAN
jgi:hypothetical protein